MPDKFPFSALLDFLKSIDGQLTQSCTVVVIGGSAVAAIDPAHATTDIDLLAPGSRDFDEAVERLRSIGAPTLPVQVVTIAEGPEGFADRVLVVPIEGALKLSVFVPERHDLAMMKLARGYEHDLQALEDIHRIEPFDLETLVSRFHETDVVGPRRRFALALLDLVARLFGEEEAKERSLLLDGLSW